MFLIEHGGKKERGLRLREPSSESPAQNSQCPGIQNTRLFTSRVARTICRIACVAAALMLPSVQIWPQNVSYNLNQHKALYLFNFAKYTEWPAGTFSNESAPFVIGILGKDPFQSDIEIIKGKTIKGRKLLIKYCNSAQEAVGCHLLFICSSETNHLSQIIPALGPGILTIAEMDGFLEHDGMINLITEQKTPGTQAVAFEINQNAAKKASLKLDTQLLKLAKRTKNS